MDNIGSIEALLESTIAELGNASTSEVPKLTGERDILRAHLLISAPAGHMPPPTSFCEDAAEGTGEASRVLECVQHAYTFEETILSQEFVLDRQVRLHAIVGNLGC